MNQQTVSTDPLIKRDSFWELANTTTKLMKQNQILYSGLNALIDKLFITGQPDKEELIEIILSTLKKASHENNPIS